MLHNGLYNLGSNGSGHPFTLNKYMQYFIQHQMLSDIKLSATKSTDLPSTYSEGTYHPKYTIITLTFASFCAESHQHGKGVGSLPARGSLV